MALFAGMPSRPILILRRLAHYAFYLVGGGVIVMSLVAMVLKFWFMPDVDRFRPDLEAVASRALGVPVHIGALAADWYGINPRLTLEDVRLVPAQGEPLVLPRVEAIGSWWSLALLEPRLSRLNLEQARFPLRRAPDGIIYLADIPLNGPGAPSPFPDWLLRQARIVIKNVQVSWLDQQLGAPPLQFSRVRLLVENRFGRHRFGGVALPSYAATRLDVRGDFKGRSVHDFPSWSGQFYARVSQAHFESWVQWVPWAQSSVKSGAGDLRFWCDLKQGRVTGLKGDARLNDVALSMRQDLPDLRFESLTGRIGWERNANSHTLFVDKLRFKLPGGAPAEPATLRLTLTPDEADGFKRIEAEAGNLRLEALTALSGALPLPRRVHDLIEALHPRGLVQSARGHWAGPKDYALHINMREGGARPYAAFPGIAGLDLKMEATHEGGKATLAGRNFLLDWPQVFRHELDFTHLDAEADWHFDDQGLNVSFQAQRVANADLEGKARGRVRLPDNGTPVVDITAHLSHGKASAVYRYLPHQVAEDVYLWLRRGLVAGHSDDVRVTLKGDLKDFPFDRGKGEFRASVRMVDGVLDYAPGWPLIGGIGGMLVFHDKAMTLTADSGRVLDAQLGPVHVEIPDLHHTMDEIAWVDGFARGDTRAFLDFVRQSPVDRYIGHFIGGFSAQGTGILALKMALPLRHVDDTTVGGAFTFQNNSITPGHGMPELTQVNGAITFSEKAVQGRGIQLRVLDMPAQLELNSREGIGLHARLSGNAGAEALRPHLPGVLAGRLRGAAQWLADVEIASNGQAAGLMVSSDLAGLAVDLPAPLGKTAAQSVPLSVEYQPDQSGMDRLTARYGVLARLNARIPQSGGTRINLHLGAGEVTEPTEPGLWISGNLRTVDLDAWRQQDWGLDAGGPPDVGKGQGGPVFHQASLNFGEAILFNRRLHDTHVRLQPAGKGWNLNLAGKEVNGEIITVPEPNGIRLEANFKRLALPEPERVAPPAPPTAGGDKTRLTNLGLNIQSLVWKQRELGELHLRLSPLKNGFKVERFLLAPPEGRLEGSGLVSDHPRHPTQLQLKLSTPQLDKLLARFGYEEAIRGGEAEVSGTLGWMGSPEDFDLRTLEGELDLGARRGQFLKVEPGAARLIGVLSLQSLPRRISLDFRDVFSQGFAFDEIKGQVHLERGSAYTQDLRMDGPAAKVSMSGVVSLTDETQNLKLKIQPRLEDTVAVAGALLGGPVVGLGTLLAGKILKNPLGQAVGFEYAISGSWADPVITKVPRKRPDAEDGTGP